MNILSTLLSINKISLFAFFITLVALVYELNLLRKKDIEKTTPVIPSFDPNLGAPPVEPDIPTPIVVKDSKKKGIKNLIIFAVLIVMLLVFGFLSFYNMGSSQTQTQGKPKAQVSVQEVQSSGIKIYDSNWQEIVGDSTDALSAGSTVYIGIAMVKGSDIDRARIKVNTDQWEATDITMDYNKDHNVFYKTYIIKENESKLQIEAQLYSKTKGWLSE